jgi:hypothetical protein
LLRPRPATCEPPGDHSKLVDGIYEGDNAAGGVDRCVGAMAVKETVLYAVAVLVIANYLASVIDGQGSIGNESSGKIECCGSAIAVQKGMIDEVTIFVSSNNLSSLVNALWRDFGAARGINCGIGALAVEET